MTFKKFTPLQIGFCLRCEGYTQQRLAVELGVSRSMVNRVIHGKSVSRRIRERIAELIGWNPWEDVNA